METKYITAGGEPTAKWKASATAGLAGLPVGVIVAYLVSTLMPDVPGEVQQAISLVVVAAVTWLFTQGPAMAAGWLKRPDPADRPVVDPATTGERVGIE